MIEVALQQHRSRDPIDAPPPLLPLDAARDERAVCGRCRHAFVDELDGQARFSPDRVGKPSRRRRLRTVRAIESQGQAHHYPGHLVAVRDFGQSSGQTLPRLGRHGLDALGDGRCRITQGEADALRPGVDGENPQTA